MKMTTFLDLATVNRLLATGGSKEVLGYLWAKGSMVVETVYGLPPTPAGKLPVEASITSDITRVDADLHIDVKTGDHTDYVVFYFEHPELRLFAENWGGIKKADICNPITERFCWDYANWLEENGLTGEKDIRHANIEGLMPGTYGFVVTAKVALQ